MHNLIQEKDLTRRKEWLEKQKAALGLFSLEKKRLRSNLIKCISSWWDGVRQTEQGSSQRCPVTRPETVSTVRKTENSLLTLRKKKNYGAWKMHVTQTTEQMIWLDTSTRWGGHIPPRRTFKFWKFRIHKLKTAKHSRQSMTRISERLIFIHEQDT